VSVRRQVWWGLALLLYVVALLVLVLAPSVPGPNRVLNETIALARAAGAPDRLTDGGGIEFLFNVVMVAPLTAVGSVLWPRLSWRHWTAGAFVAFTLVELVQGALLAHRDGSMSDVVANTAGCCLGALAAVAVRRVMRQRAAAATA
jgi:glycopeptide antibiotics resistance protein